MAKIMVVDDSGLSRRMMRGILEADGHQVVEAEDGMTALERYFLERPDLVTLDLTMSGMHGLDVLGKLRELDSGARVVVATADIQSSTRALVEGAGAAGLVHKPLNAQEVREVVSASLEGGRT